MKFKLKPRPMVETDHQFLVKKEHNILSFPNRKHAPKISWDCSFNRPLVLTNVQDKKCYNITGANCHSRGFVGWMDSLGRIVAWSVCGWTDRQGSVTARSSRLLIREPEMSLEARSQVINSDLKQNSYHSLINFPFFLFECFSFEYFPWFLLLYALKYYIYEIIAIERS